MLRLKEILKKKKITQKQLSLILGISEQSTSSWAQNKSEPSLKMSLRICEALNITLNELVDQKGE
jgi:transcriptional regulator with XRE-family HTH domain